MKGERHPGDDAIATEGGLERSPTSMTENPAGETAKITVFLTDKTTMQQWPLQGKSSNGTLGAKKGPEGDLLNQGRSNITFRASEREMT